MAANVEAEKDARIPCYFGFTNQKQWKHYIQDLLKKNDNAVVRGVIQIYNRQTFDEQVEQESNVENGIGFSKNDAPFMSTVAIAFITGKKVDAKTFEIARNKMLHYWKQLMEISKEGLDAKLKDIKFRLLEKDLEEKEKQEEEYARDNTDSECNNHSNTGGNHREGAQGYLFPELFGEAEEGAPSDNPPDCGCSNNAGSDSPQP